ncbi:MAG: BMC domain-containing protein [Candidatus Cloacimonetes bacterium]|nr:BMC domain-containing protein [Candidatus Cloacimonadota bacterium]
MAHPDPPRSEQAIGLLETRGLVAAVVACDAMLKTSQVSLLQQQVTRPALVTICIMGEVAAVNEALAAGARAAARVGPVLSRHLIPRPTSATLDLLSHLALDVHALAIDAQRPLASLSVSRLRALARERSDFPLSGREISLANRTTLLALLEPPEAAGSGADTPGENDPTLGSR